MQPKTVSALFSHLASGTDTILPLAPRPCLSTLRKYRKPNGKRYLIYVTVSHRVNQVFIFFYLYNHFLSSFFLKFDVGYARRKYSEKSCVETSTAKENVLITTYLNINASFFIKSMICDKINALL